MAKEKIDSGEIVAEVSPSEGEPIMAKEKVVMEFPDIDEQGFQKVMSAEGEVVYARQIAGGCEKKVNDNIEFKPGAYIREWTCNGVPHRYELMGG